MLLVFLLIFFPSLHFTSLLLTTVTEQNAMAMLSSAVEVKHILKDLKN